LVSVLIFSGDELMKASPVMLIPLLASAQLLNGCAQTPAPPAALVEEIDYAELGTVRNPALAWTEQQPGLDLAGYRRVALELADFTYRDVRPVARSSRPPGNRNEFPISERDREELQQSVSSAFSDALAGSGRFALSEEQQGEDLLLMRVRLLDIVSRVPPEPAARSDTFIDSVGEATIVIELVDSRSGRILARTADRRTAEPPPRGPGGFGALRSSPVTAWQEVRRTLRRWAALARDRLEELA